MTEDYARFLRERRIQLGLSRSNLAHKARVAEGVIHRIEKRNQFPSDEALKRICAALDLEPPTDERS